MQKLTLKLNDRASIEIEAETSQDVIRTAAFWQSLPSQCAICQASLVFDYQTPQTYKYYKLKCTGPVPHAVNLSERTDKSGMYFDNRKSWDTWRAGVEPDNATGVPAGNNAVAGVAGPNGTNQQTTGRNEQNGTHPNAPDSERASLIRAVKRYYDDCRDRNIPGYEKVNLNILGKFTDQQLRNAGTFLMNLLEHPKQQNPR